MIFQKGLVPSQIETRAPQASMLRKKWDQAQRLFLAAADLSRQERVLFLEQSCAGDSELRTEVESLILADIGSAEYIAAAVESEASKLFDFEFTLDRVGPYRILRQLGRGGMGAVFLATRDDDQYRKQVAIKVVKRGMDTAEVLERFRHERQILANLDHPYIARLHDGGTTADGLPYFVMEFVEGQPVDLFCRERALDTKARLRIFVKVCEAVAYAHRNLVVHRDLKPPNIFVTAAGTPKLLDFGIAKLTGGDPSATATASQVFTPDYASPEQVRGEPISTATDVYSLGAVLYELLTGDRAQKVTAVTPLEVDRAICQTEVKRPSLAAPHVDTELDNIVLMAMRKEPSRRYASADQFAEDVQRYLDGEPVMARQNSFLYRVRKWIQRHRLEAAAASVVAVSLIAATAVSGLQYRRAEAERIEAVRERTRAETESRQAVEARQAETGARRLADQQRDEAQLQRARAEQRLTDLIDLANRSLFDVHTAVESLPGAVGARRMIVKTTLDYLERLEKDAGADNRIRLALSAAYYKIGLIQGSTASPGLQDFAGAHLSLAKAEALLAPLYGTRPADPVLIMRWIETQSGLADVQFREGHAPTAVALYRKVLPVARRLGLMLPNDVQAAKQEGAIHLRLAQTLFRQDPAGGLEHVRRQLDLTRALIVRFPSDKALKKDLGTGLAVVASVFVTLDNLDRAAESFRQSIELREDLLRDDPNNVSLQRDLIVVNGNNARLLGVPWSQNLGRIPEARVAAARAVALARAMIAADPQNANARLDLSMSLSRLGSIQPEPGGAAESLAILQEAIGLMEAMRISNPKSQEIPVQMAVALEWAGHRLEGLGRPEEAAREYLASLAALGDDSERGHGAIMQAIMDYEALALLYASTGESTRAFEYARKGLVAAGEQFAAVQPSEARMAHLARSYFVLASVYSKFNQWDDARQAAEEALKRWRPIRNQGILRLHQRDILEAGELVRKAEAFDREKRRRLQQPPFISPTPPAA
jgi:tetratricopeptide (TPR) repeat protein